MKLKKDFELSLWEDFMDTQNGKQFINERKICTIASQTLDSPSAAYNVIFKSKTNGTHELSFDINYRYWDQVEQDFIENPFRKYLFNEAKVKLKYKGKWFDFVIKNCSENSKKKKFSYTCKDLYIDELGRNGYSVEFSTSLGGNTGDVTELAAVTLKDSDWRVSEDSIIPIQKVEEAVYAYTLPDDTVIQYQEINEDGTKGIEGEIRNTKSNDGNYKNKTIFILYSCANNEDCKDVDYQFYYNKDEKYEVNDDGFFIHTNIKFPTKIGIIKEEDGVEVITWQEENRIQFSNATHTFNPSYRGYRYVRSQKVEWLPKIGKMVGIYNKNGQEYYGYQKTTYLSPEIAQNVLINSSFGAFDGTSGWRAFSDNKGECEIELGGEYGYNEQTRQVWLGGEVYLKAYYYDNTQKKHYPGDVLFYNSAFEYNLKNIGALTQGEVWVCRCLDSVDGPIYANLPSDVFQNLGSLNLSGIEPPKDYESVKTPNNDGYIYFLYKVNKSKTYTQLLNAPLELSFHGGYRDGYGFFGAEFFRYYTYKNENNEETLITPETEIDVKNLIKNEYYYFTKEQYEACRNENDLEISFMEDTEPSKDTFVYNDPEFKKVITLETKESNYYNIIQTLNEKFDCWADFQIEHNEDGSTKVVDGKRQKWVIFKNYIGKENWSGFKYGINLDGIQRTIDSEEITTKTIVKPNSNEFGKNGFCTIARAKGNPTGSNAIINLDYFIRQGVLKENEVRGDLYVESDNTLGYYARLKRLNDGIQEIENRLIGIDNAILKANTVIQSNDISEEEFAEDMKVVNEKLSNNIIGFNDDNTPKFAIGDAAIFYKDTNSPNWGINTLPIFEWTYQSSITFYHLADEKNVNGGYVAYPPGNNIIYNLTQGRELVDNYNKFIKDRYYATENKRELEIEKAELTAFRDGKYSYVDVDGIHQYYTYENGILKHGDDIITNDIIPTPAPNKPLSQQVRELEKEFYSKYYRFIREGTWTSEDYTDDELYYYDACSVSYTSAFPKTTYSISVVDIKNAIIPDELGYNYSNYDFNCGDLTTIEDTEFFGWTIENNKRRPYREIVVISETEDHLDNPDGDKITVQNYKTQFDDLFQRMAAATQTLELKEGVYDRAGNAINLNGTINKVLLQNTLYNNELILQNAGAQNLEWSDRGIIAQDLSNQAYVTRIVGGGILISEDGGKNWSVGISGKGINASNIKTGQLDVGKIKILNGNDVSFSWDINGINGYDKNIDGSYNFSKYTRMDRFGFYCVDGEADDYAPETEEEIWGIDDDGIFDINNKVIYCLLKKGLRLGKGDNGIILDISGSEAILTVNGTINANSGRIGGWFIHNNALTCNDPSGTSNNIQAIIDATKINKENEYVLSFGTTSGTFSGFRVTGTGKLYATGADISGKITANTGYIGGENGWTISAQALTNGSIGTASSGGIHLYTNCPKNYTLAGHTANNWRLAIGNNFGVDRNGNIYAKGANITGEIKADSGYIGGENGWNISANTFYNRIQDDNGIYCWFDLYSYDSGNGKWMSVGDISNGEIFALTTDGTIKCNNCYFTGSSESQWAFQNGILYGSFYDNTQLYSRLDIDPRIIRLYKDNHSYHLTWLNLLDTLFLLNYDQLSVFNKNNCGTGKIRLGYNGINFKDADGNWGCIAFEDSYNSNSGIIIEAPNSKTTISGVLYTDSGGVEQSDLKAKNSIMTIYDNYEIFYDNLVPSIFKYNDGTSNRLHSGFIAQGVKKAMDIASIPTSDFGGLVIQNLDKPEEEQKWGLRYTEFIALNTWQIQKLKSRVTELENEIQSLKQKLS